MQNYIGNEKSYNFIYRNNMANDTPNLNVIGSKDCRGKIGHHIVEVSKKVNGQRYFYLSRLLISAIEGK